MPRAAELEQLDKEADELLKQANEAPATPDSPSPAPDSEPTPPLDAEPEPNAEPTPEKPTPSPAKDTDELDGLTLENAQERISNAQARMHTATTEAKELRRTAETLTRRVQELEGEVQQLKDAKAAPPAMPDSVAVIEPQSLEELKDSYPTLHDKFIGPLLTQVQALTGKLGVLSGEMSTVKTTVEKKADAPAPVDPKVQEHYDTILAKHKDAFSLIEDDNFQGWLSRQSALRQRVMKDGTAAEVIEVFDAYKQAVGKARIDTARTVETPATPRARATPTTKPTFTRREIAAMSNAEYLAREGEIDQAMQEGRITP